MGNFLTAEETKLNIPQSDMPRVVVIGAGFAGVEFIKAMEGTAYQVVMLEKNNYHTFQPLLYQVATGTLEPDTVAGTVRDIVKQENVLVRMAEVQYIDADNKTLRTNVGDLSYDYLVLANGSKPNFFGNKDMEKYAFPLKEAQDAMKLREHLFKKLEHAVVAPTIEKQSQLLSIIVVGGGPTGVEVAGALAELKKQVMPQDYPDVNIDRMQIYLVEGTDSTLPQMSDTASEKSYEYLKEMGVNVMLNTMVEEYDGVNAKLSDNAVLKAETLIWGAGVKGNILDGIKESAVEKSRIIVDDYLRVQGHRDVFAIGDLACLKTEEYPKGYPMLAPVAIQQGKAVASNLKRLLEQKQEEPFSYFDKGTMATVGRNRAVVDLPNGSSFGGVMAWLSWMFVHLWSIIGFRRKLVIFSNWIYNYFTRQKANRSILDPSKNANKDTEPERS